MYTMKTYHNSKLILSKILSKHTQYGDPYEIFDIFTGAEPLNKINSVVLCEQYPR